MGFEILDFLLTGVETLVFVFDFAVVAFFLGVPSASASSSVSFDRFLLVTSLDALRSEGFRSSGVLKGRLRGGGIKALILFTLPLAASLVGVEHVIGELAPRSEELLARAICGASGAGTSDTGWKPT